MSESDPKAALFQTIADKRADIGAFLGQALPRQRRLANLAIVSGALATGLTAVPGVGGKAATDSLGAALGADAPLWQLFCLAAALCAVTATIANGLAKADDRSARVQRAQICEVRLEALETMLRLDQLSVAEATERYVNTIQEVSLR